MDWLPFVFICKFPILLRAKHEREEARGHLLGPKSLGSWPRVGWRDVLTCQETSSSAHSLPWGLQKLAGHKSPGKKIWIWRIYLPVGWQKVKILEDEGVPHPWTLRSLGRSPVQANTLHQLTGVQWQSALELPFQVAQSCTQGFKHTFLSCTCKLRHQIIDILQMYLLQFVSWGFFFKFCAGVSYYCLLTGSWPTVFHSCQLMLDKAEGIRYQCVTITPFLYFINLMKWFWE